MCLCAQMAEGDDTFPDLYAVFGVLQDATDNEVKAAFRRQILLVHPDKLGPMASDAERQLFGHAYCYKLKRC